MRQSSRLLSGVTLSGLLLASSILSQSPQILHDSLQKPVSASDYEPSSTTQFLNNHFHLNTEQLSSMSITQTTKTIIPKMVQGQNNLPENISKQVSNVSERVHTAQITNSKLKQVSRGSTGFSDLVEHALSLLGTPYVFGGTTQKGFDCSGFTQYVFAWSGISIPRTSYTQFASGIAVNKSELQPGDLVFFTTYSKGASHVGIYIGAGQFIHADNPRVGVTVTSISNSYYVAHYLGARRYE